eukprot:15431874-Alexandrium_andersonii.AAC.1
MRGPPNSLRELEALALSQEGAGQVAALLLEDHGASHLHLALTPIAFGIAVTCVILDHLESLPQGPISLHHDLRLGGLESDGEWEAFIELRVLAAGTLKERSGNLRVAEVHV